MDTVGSRIREARKAKGLQQKELAAKLAMDKSTISRWETDDQGITLANAVALASELDVSVQWLNTGEDARPVGNAHLRVLRVVGEVQAGVWKESIEFPIEDQDDETVLVQSSRRNLTMSVFIVRGTSMNMRFHPDQRVVVASTIANGLKPKDKDFVLVSRKSKDGLYESTLKQYIIEDGKEMLYPRSTDPNFQKPIPLKKRGTEEVVITGIVVQAYNNFDLDGV